MHGLFFTGTDTGVGKTHVMAAVARILRRQGRRVAVSKPVATDAQKIGASWQCVDTMRLAESAGMSLDLVTPWAFPDALAPPLAARRQGVELRLTEIVQAVEETATLGELILVEGVGGLLCPLTESETIADLASALALPLVVVTRRSLGTLNHTLLTLEVARQRRLQVAGVVVNETGPVQGLAEETNVDELRRICSAPILATVPYDRADREPAALAAVDWGTLSGCKA